MRAVIAHTFWLKLIPGTIRPARMWCSNFSVSPAGRAVRGAFIILVIVASFV
jgi:hypothetical protein